MPDTNPNGTRDEIKLYFPDEADDRLAKRYQWVKYLLPPHPCSSYHHHSRDKESC